MGKAQPLFERFEAKVDRSAGPDGCHIWTGGVGQYNTPQIMIAGKRTTSARRVAWEIITGAPPPEKRWVTTTCENSRCLNPAHLKLRPLRDNEARFWAHVDKNGPVVRSELGPCWLWMAGTQRGYGLFHIWLPNARKDPNGKRTRVGKRIWAHRYAYEYHNGPIPSRAEELIVMHKCDNPRCVNPAHLELGTDAKNIADCIAKGRNSRGEKHGRIVREARARKQATQRHGEGE